MGEARAMIKLTNATDHALYRRGQLTEDAIRIYQADALIDTGAVQCCIPQFVADQLGLDRVGHRTAQYADGCLEQVDLTDGIIIEISGRRTLEEALVLGDEVIIGQTVLEKLDLRVDCRERRITPNPAHPDQPISKIK
ncbi:MAG: clan AA aspartic protease [bacterium]|nr:clan AA aspartic protease [bacterium]